jgi:DNA-binding beta-propeller fold protein YncE
MRRLFAPALLILAAGAAVAAPEGYQLLKTVPVPGDGGWDYVLADDAGRRVYVSHGTEVVVLDADSYEIKGTIADQKGVHGIAVVPDLGRGFISNGQGNNVTIFDTKTLKPTGSVETGKNPDCIIYDPSTKTVLAFNGRDASATVIDPKEGKATGTIALGGKPEYAVSDGKGAVYVNIEDKNQILRLDPAALKVVERYPVDPGEAPGALTIDRKNRRLFIGCHNKMMVVMDADSGKVVTKEPIGERTDAAAFDPETGLVYFSNGEGTISVIKQDGPDKYSTVETIKTQTGSKTMALDVKTHKIFLPMAEFKADPDNPKARPKLTPGTFAVQVYGKAS